MQQLERRTLLPVLLLGTIALIAPAQAVAYKEEVHAALTQEAVYFYNQHFKGSPIKSGDIKHLMEGARREDDMPRMLNHFYDPINNRGLVFGYKTWTSSKQWAKSPDSQTAFLYNRTGKIASYFSSKAGQETDFTWQRAISDFIDGDRERAMQGLGHVLHLIEDAAVPAHTRNDPHPPTDENDKEWGGPDPYEEWTARFVPADDAPRYQLERINVVGALNRNKKKPIQLSSLDQYLDQLATYTNTHFYSKDSIGFNYYALPNSQNTKQSGKFLYLSGNDGEGEFRLARVLRSNTIVNNQAISPDEIRVNDDEISIAYWDRLSQKAVQYAAGAIDLFFQEVEKEKARRAKLPAPNFAGNVLGTVGSGGDPSAAPQDNPVESQSDHGASTTDIEEPTPEELANNLDFAQQAVDQLNLALAPESPTQKSEQPEPQDEQEPTRGSSGSDGNEPQIDEEPKEDPSSATEVGTQDDATEQSDDSPSVIPSESEESQAETPEPTPTVLISELYIDMPGADTEEFIELYNATDTDIDISAWSLQYLTGSATSTAKIDKKNFEAGATVPAKGFYLITLKNYAGSRAADMEWKSINLNNTGATIFLVSHQDKLETEADEQIADRVGYGTGGGVILSEGEAISAAESGSSLERKAAGCASAVDYAEFNGNSCDTNDNAADFAARSTPTPQNSQNFLEPRAKPTTPALTINYEPEALIYTRLDLGWTDTQDYRGQTDDIEYLLTDADGAEIYRGTELTFEHKISEVNRNYNFTLQALDAEGYGSEVVSAEQFVPTYISSLEWSETPSSTQEDPIYALSISWDEYPFIPVNIPFNNEVKDGWHVIVLQYNTDPFAEPSMGAISNGKNIAGWGHSIDMPNPFWINYDSCRGQLSKVSSIILADSVELCTTQLQYDAQMRSLHRDYWSDGMYEFAIHNSMFADNPPTSESYITISYYAYQRAVNNPFTNMRLIATDAQKYYFSPTTEAAE